MVQYTRRTHVVRIPMDGADPPTKNPVAYIDVEVLDAIAFRIWNGEEVIIDMKTANSRPHIIDNVGGGNARSPANPTQRTHMERIKSGSNQLDVEVLDVMSCRDQNGREWILDMRSDRNDYYDVTDHTGSSKATRRVHDEKIFAGKKPAPGAAPGTDYLTCQRCDNLAFRTINGKEVIILCPSYDDGSATGKRASTYIWSPQGYDPSNEDGPKPPANKDAHVYVAPVKGSGGFLTGAEKIKPGPFWWIRKVKHGDGVLVLDMNANLGWSAGHPPQVWNAWGFDVPGGVFDMALDAGGFDANGLVSPAGSTNPLPHAGDGLGLNWFGYRPFVEETSTTSTLFVQVSDLVRWEGVISGFDTHEFFIDLSPGTPADAVAGMSGGYATEFGHAPVNTHIPPDLGAYPATILASHPATLSVTSTTRKVNNVFVIPIANLQTVADEDGIATFRVVTPNAGVGGSQRVALAAITYKVTPDFPALDFPVDDHDLPLFDPHGDLNQDNKSLIKGGESATGWVFTITVDVKTLALTMTAATNG